MMRAAIPDTVVTPFLDDWIRVADMHLTLPGMRRTRIGRALRESIVALTLPDYDTMARVVGHVLFELNWRRHRHPLTPDDAQTYAAARRFWAAVHRTDRVLQENTHARTTPPR